MKIIGGILQYSLAMISGALALFSFQMISTSAYAHSAFFFALGLILTGLSLTMSVLVGQFIGSK